LQFNSESCRNGQLAFLRDVNARAMLRSKRLGSDKQLRLAAENSPPLMSGASGSGVAILQDLLADLGQTLDLSFRRTGHADGIFGKETERAVKAFQTRQRLLPDGKVGKLTLAALDIIICHTPDLETPDAAAVRAQERAVSAGPVSQRAFRRD
jgi:peptidoglycan hydrolase-like protein with peptidoglycan-binding domain